MTIDELFLDLYNDELSDMFPANRHNPDDSRAKLLPLVNSVMRLAYAKWKVKYNSYMLATTENVHEYEIPESVGVLPDPVVLYPLLQIVRIVNVYGLDVPQTEWEALGRKLYFPYPENQTLEVVFKVPHTFYLLAQDDAMTVLELPDMLVPWLKAMVCYRYFAPMKTDSAVAKATDFLAQALMHETMFVQTNTTNEFTAPTNRKMHARGFA